MVFSTVPTFCVLFKLGWALTSVLMFVQPVRAVSKLFQVIGDMFSVEPEQRPSARQIVVRLEAILSELPEP